MLGKTNYATLFTTSKQNLFQTLSRLSNNPHKMKAIKIHKYCGDYGEIPLCLWLPPLRRKTGLQKNSILLMGDNHKYLLGFLKRED